MKIDNYKPKENYQENGFFQNRNLIIKNILFEKIIFFENRKLITFNEFEKIRNLIIDNISCKNDNRLSKMVNFIVTEILHNTFTYCVSNSEFKITICILEKKIYFLSECFLDKNKEIRLNIELSEINQFNEIANNKDKLKNKHIELLGKSEISDGTNNEFVILIRKTENKLLHNIDEINENHKIFSFITKLNIENKADNIY